MPPGSDRVEIKTSYLELADLPSADARSIIAAVECSFKNIGIENYLAKLVGFGSDGAAVNCGKKEGIITLLRKQNAWLTFGWCVAHKLELALEDSLSGTSFDDVDELILRMYYLYKRSPKKLRQLKELMSVYEDSENFSEGGVRPKKASGNNHFSFFTVILKILFMKVRVFCFSCRIFLEHIGRYILRMRINKSK